MKVVLRYLFDPHTSGAKEKLAAIYYIWRIYDRGDRELITMQLPDYIQLLAATRPSKVISVL
jgi:hypothetical protein